MIDQVVEQEVKIKDEDGNYISHTMYVITDVRQGVGDSPSFADEAYVTYKGMFLDGYSFDSNDQPLWFSGIEYCSWVFLRITTSYRTRDLGS